MMNTHRADTTVPINFRTTPGQKEAAEAIAKARGVSISGVLRAALEEHVAKSSVALRGDTADSVVAEVAPMLEQQFDSLTRSLEALHGRLAALEARK